MGCLYHRMASIPFPLAHDTLIQPNQGLMKWNPPGLSDWFSDEHGTHIGPIRVGLRTGPRSPRRGGSRGLMTVIAHSQA